MWLVMVSAFAFTCLLASLFGGVVVVVVVVT